MTETWPLARWNTTMRRAWARLRDFRTVQVVVRERATLRPGPGERELLHWAGAGLELHGWFLPSPERDRPGRPHLGEPMAQQIGRSARSRRDPCSASRPELENSLRKVGEMNQQQPPRLRPIVGPQYYQGRPADWWITRLRGRRGQPPDSSGHPSMHE